MATRMKSSPEESHSADNGAEAPSISKKAQQTRERILPLDVLQTSLGERDLMSLDHLLNHRTMRLRL